MFWCPKAAQDSKLPPVKPVLHLQPSPPTCQDPRAPRAGPAITADVNSCHMGAPARPPALGRAHSKLIFDILPAVPEVPHGAPHIPISQQGKPQPQPDPVGSSTVDLGTVPPEDNRTECPTPRPPCRLLELWLLLFPGNRELQDAKMSPQGPGAGSQEKPHSGWAAGVQSW